MIFRIGLVFSLLAVGATPQDGGRRIEELEKKVRELTRRLNELEEMMEHLIDSNERNASASLKVIGTAQTEFQLLDSDRDENGRNDFWVGDLSGLYPYTVNGEQLRLIERGVAEADTAPVDLKELGKALVAKPKPKLGYCYAAIAKYADGGKDRKYDTGNHRKGVST